MWTNLLRSSFIIGLLLIGVRAFAAQELTLEQLREEVLTKNIPIQIQYEKYYQAQKNISVARGEFLPGASIQLINVNTTLAILQSVVPTPSEWFVYQASQELAVAEGFTTESVKLNILEGLSINYINIKYYQALLPSMRLQEANLLDAWTAARQEQELGANNASVVYSAQRQYLQQQQDIYALESLILAEKQAMLIALSRDPSLELELADLPESDLAQLPASKEEAAELAVRNSNELMSNKFQYEAAQYMTSSARWAWLSFNGIGFDYAARISIEKSKARIIALEAEQLKLKARNQVFAAYKQLQILEQRLALQDAVVASVREIEARQTELFQNRLITFAALTEARNTTLAELRTLTKLEHEFAVKVIQVKRLLSLDAALATQEAPRAEELSLTLRQSRSRMGSKLLVVELSAPSEVAANIFSVTYFVNDAATGVRSLKKGEAFKYIFKPGTERTIKVKALVQTLVGGSVEKTVELTVQ